MYILGKTNIDVVTIVSHEKQIELNQYLVAETVNGREIIEVIETTSVPLHHASDDSFVEQYNSLLQKDGLGGHYDTLYVAKGRILQEQKQPIKSGTRIEPATYEEVSSFIIKSSLKDSIVLGQINGTNELYEDLPSDLKQVAPMFYEKEGFVPQNAAPFLLSAKWSFEYPHVCYIGSSGSGKSHGLRVHCEEYMDKRMPSIFFDIHKEMTFHNNSKEHPVQKDYSSNHVVCQIGEHIGIDFTELTITELIGLLTFVADLTDPMKYALQTVYEPKDSFDTLRNRLTMLKEAFENQDKPANQRDSLSKEHEALYRKYQRSVSGTSTLQALLWRLNGLDKPSLFRKDSSLLETSLKQRKFVVVQAQNALELKMYAYYILKKLYGKRRQYKESHFETEAFPPFTTFFDEAHNFAPNTLQSDPIKSIIKELAQESRKYGVFLVMSTQRPSLLDRTVMAQLNTKVIFRTTIAEDIEMVAKETNLTKEETKRLPFLTSGQGFILNPKFGRTLYIRFRATYTVSPHSLNPYDELESFNMAGEDADIILNYLKGISPKMMPETNMRNLQQIIENELGTTLTILDLKERLKEMELNGYIKSKKSAMGMAYFV